MGNYPWIITVTQAASAQSSLRTAEQDIRPVPERYLSGIREGLAFQYAHTAATHMPSKQTATDLKGREKDLEVSENAPIRSGMVRKWRSPSFLKTPISGKEFGNIMHTVMQYISFENCTSDIGIRTELQRLTEKGFLTQEQMEKVDSVKLLRFFGSEMGQKLLSGIPYLREFKFSILDDGKRYDPALEREQVLLQGVVDCALLEEDGITVIDFKTDFVTEETIGTVVNRYRRQVEIYADALQRIYELPVKNRYLYLFHLDRLVTV